MNRSIAIVICSIIGAAIGGGAAYIYLNKKYDEVFNNEVDGYKNRISELEAENEKLNERIVEKLEDAKEKFFKDKGIIEPDDPEDVEDDDDNGCYSEEAKQFGNIRFISKKDYEDDDDYEKEEFEYYMMDGGVIVQDNDILDVEDFESVCGTSALTLLKKDKSLARWSSGDDNELYIRNEDYVTDYKIKRYHKAYNPNITSI